MVTTAELAEGTWTKSGSRSARTASSGPRRAAVRPPLGKQCGIEEHLPELS